MDQPSFCSESDAKVLREILTFFYPDLPPARITQPAAILACNMFNELAASSRSIDSASRPAAVRLGFLYPAIRTVTSAWRQRFRRNKGVYENYRLTIALNRRSEYALTQSGVDA